MNTEIKKEVLIHCEERDIIKCGKGVETEITLPDYCSDIKRILKCTLTPGIHSVSLSGERINIKGTGLIRVIYTDENGKADCCEKILELSFSGPCRQSQEHGSVVVKAFTDYVNCRALSPRRITVSGSVSAVCDPLSEKKTEVISSCPDGVEQQKETQKEEVLICRNVKSFDISEVAVIEKEKPSVAKLLNRRTYINVEAEKAVENKVLLKGELKIYLLYCTDEGRVCKAVHSMPISQIMEAQGMKSGCELRTDCFVSELTVNPKADSSGDGRLLDISAKITCLVSAYESAEYEYVKDCYCTKGKYEAVCSSRKAKIPENVSEKTTKFSHCIKDTQIKELYDLWLTDFNCTFSGDEAVAKIVSTVCFLYLDEEDKVCYKEEEVQFLYESGLDCTGEDRECQLYAFPCEISGVTDGGGLQITAEVFFRFCIYKTTLMQYVSSLKECEEKKEKSPSVVAYYYEKGEDLWNIAKRYRANLSLLRQENDIQHQVTQDKGMLLISCG